MKKKLPESLKGLFRKASDDLSETVNDLGALTNALLDIVEGDLIQENSYTVDMIEKSTQIIPDHMLQMTFLNQALLMLQTALAVDNINITEINSPDDALKAVEDLMR